MNNPYMVGKDDPNRAGGIIMEDWGREEGWQNCR